MMMMRFSTVYFPQPGRTRVRRENRTCRCGARIDLSVLFYLVYILSLSKFQVCVILKKIQVCVTFVLVKFENYTLLGFGEVLFNSISCAISVAVFD